MPRPDERDDVYFELMARALRVCAVYKPKFGKGGDKGLTVKEFQEVYGADPFYAWVGLDSPLMYAAHKAAGGMTSIYRQLGMGAQWVFKQVLIDNLGLTAAQAEWGYTIPAKGDQKERKLTLDGRVDVADVKDGSKHERVQAWMAEAGKRLGLPAEIDQQLRGAVFEVRQGYKSMDSKRQNADIANATNAYVHFYLPVIALMSLQIDEVLVTRYTASRWLILRGRKGGTPFDSTYAFCREVVGYDLAAFFERNSPRIRAVLEDVLKNLMESK